MNAYEHTAGSRSAGEDTFTPDLTNRQSAKSKARMNDDDDIYFGPRNARENHQSALPKKFLKALVACVLIRHFCLCIYITYMEAYGREFSANQLF